jgi:hypothetical protein
VTRTPRKITSTDLRICAWRESWLFEVPFSWRKRFNAESASGTLAANKLMPVTLLDIPQPAVGTGTGVIVLSVGKIQLRLEGQVDTGTLSLLLARLLP